MLVLVWHGIHRNQRITCEGVHIKMLKEFRLNQGLTQQEVADIVGCSRSLVYQWEKGIRSPTIEQLERLASHCGTTLEVILWTVNSDRKRVRKKRPRS